MKPGDTFECSQSFQDAPCRVTIRRVEAGVLWYQFIGDTRPMNGEFPLSVEQWQAEITAGRLTPVTT